MIIKTKAVNVHIERVIIPDHLEERFIDFSKDRMNDDGTIDYKDAKWFCKMNREPLKLADLYENS